MTGPMLPKETSVEMRTETVTSTALQQGCHIGIIQGTLAIKGALWNWGLIDTGSIYSSGENNITIDPGPMGYGRAAYMAPGLLANETQITLGIPGAYQTNTIRGGTLQNDGRVSVSWIAKIDSETTGTGTFNFQPRAAHNSCGTLEFDRKVGAGQTVDMTNDGTLKLYDIREFMGTVKGFSKASAAAIGDTLQVHGAVDRARYVGTRASGELDLLSGGRLVGAVKLTGADYRGHAFSAAQVGTDTQIRMVS